MSVSETNIEDLIFTDQENCLFDTLFYVAADHTKKKMVIAIRGN